jgi:ABC-type phosphate transport system substrate-binding protein
MTSPARSARGRGLAIGGAVAAIAASIWPGAAGATASPTTAPVVTPVTLNGEGSWDIAAEFTTWSNALYGQAGILTANYIPDGGFIGRQDFAAGDADYVVSGVGFTPAQLESLKGGASDLIEAPIMPSAVGFMFQPPTGDFDVVNSTTGTEIQHYDGPFNVPLANVSAMMLDYAGVDPSSGDQQDSYVEWDDPAITRSWPGLKLRGDDALSTGNFISDGPQQYERSDPDETSYYLQQMMIGKEPELWKTALSEDQDPSPPTIHDFTETYPPYIPVQTKPGSQLEVEALLANAGSTGSNGTIADVPPSAMAQVRQFNASQAKQKLARVEVRWLGIPNRSGHYIDPTPTTIDASIDAGGAIPLYALHHRVTDGYPLTYVDDLYAPAHGLDEAKTEGIATMIRYLVTDGQAVTARFGDGRLSPALVSQALTAANQLVDSNCTQAGEVVVKSADPGPYAPHLHGIDRIGSMDNCALSSAATDPTTTTTPTTPPVTVPPATTPPATTPAVTAPTTTTPTTTTPTTTPPTTTAPATTTTTRPRHRRPGTSSGTATTTPPSHGAATPPRSALSAAVLGSADLEAPDPSGGFDHLAALLIGAALFLLARRPAKKLLRSLRS